MTLAAFAFAALSGVLVDYSSRPLAGGGHEYIIQVPPELIDTLRAEGIESYIPPEARDVRKIRIQVGSDPLPPAAGLLETPADEAGANSDAASVARESGSRTDDPDETRTHVAQYASGPRGNTTATSDITGQPESGAGPFDLAGLDATTLLQIALGVAALAILSLVWLHLGMRSRYRELLHRVYDPPHAPRREPPFTVSHQSLGDA
jgi:hypothetical protein